MDKPFLERRYLISFDSRRIRHIFTDVLIIGAGAAGLRAAIEAAKSARVIILTKADISKSNTYLAQGGIAAVMAPDDTIEAHIADTLSQAPETIEELISWGLEVDRHADGTIALGREGGHSANRIVHAHGDATGKYLIETLLSQVKQNDDITIFDNCFAIDLVSNDPQAVETDKPAAVVGAITYHERYGVQMIWARQTILAGGGAGMLWRETTNPPQATADGIAMAFRAGAELAEMEMMQFHPTTLYIAGATRSLISEAVRGDGAYLVDRNGYRFMKDYHPDGELAPRDVVSRAIADYTAKTRTTHVFLDVRHIGAEKFKERFPSIYQLCKDFDIDISKDLIPVRPAAHYMIGGIKTDVIGRTTLPGLWACGEVACTGLHGANRLASNSLLEALVFGKAAGAGAADCAARENEKLTAVPIISTNPPSERTELDLADIRNSLRSVMWRNVGIVRTGARLEETREIISFWGRYVMDKELATPDGWEVQNMLTVAMLTTECALRRTESRGVHYRKDYPSTDPAWTKRQIIKRTSERLVIS